MRLTSKCISFMSAIFPMSFITLALTLSRCARDLNTIYENTTVSLAFNFIIRENGVPHFVLRSSPTHSLKSRAPCFRHIFPPNLSHAKVGLQVFLWYRQHVAINVAHQPLLFLNRIFISSAFPRE